MLLAALAAEVLIRLVAPQPKSWLEIYRRHPELPFHALLPNENHTASTGESSWTVRTDDFGFRCHEPAAAAGAGGVLWLGDSFAFGHGVDYELSFIGRLALASAGRVRHWNSGVPGYGPVQYEQVFRYYEPRLRPRFAVICLYVGNDFHDCLWQKDGPVSDGILGKGAGLAQFVKANSHLYRLLAASAHRLGLGAPRSYAEVERQLRTPEEWRGPFLTEAMVRTRQAIGSLVSAAHTAGVDLHAVIIPTAAAVAFAAAPGSTDGDPLLPVQRMREILTESGIDFLDASEVLRGLSAEAVFYRFDGHLTPLAHERVARALGERWPFLATGK